MKKVLVTVAALGLALGVASNALALDKPSRATEVEATTAPRVPTATAPGVALWSVSGQYVLAGAYLSDGMGAAIADVQGIADDNSDDFWIHSFKILPVLQVNDKIAMKGELRFADRDVWGLTDTSFSNDFASSSGGRIMDVYHVYMEWMSPIGKTRVGRTPCGAWGTKFGNSSSKCNRIMLWGNWMPENWGMLAFHQKSKEEDATNLSSDGDNDTYYIDISYKADMGKTVAAFLTTRVAAINGGSGGDYSTRKFWLTGKYAWDALNLEYEVDYNFGECATSSCDQDSLGLYADLGYNAGDFSFGLKAMYASGDDDSDDDAENFMGAAGLGRDFNPQQIMTGDYMLLLNGDNPLTVNSVRPDVMKAGAMAFIGYASYKATPKLTLNADIGQYNAVDEAKGYDDDYGMEFGVGLSYKLYDNLTYAAHFSYLKTGDFWESSDYYPNDDGKWENYGSVYGSADDTEDMYLLAHAISMKF